MPGLGDVETRGILWEAADRAGPEFGRRRSPGAAVIRAARNYCGRCRPILAEEGSGVWTRSQGRPRGTWREGCRRVRRAPLGAVPPPTYTTLVRSIKRVLGAHGPSAPLGFPSHHLSPARHLQRDRSAVRTLGMAGVLEEAERLITGEPAPQQWTPSPNALLEAGMAALWLAEVIEAPTHLGA